MPQTEFVTTEWSQPNTWNTFTHWVANYKIKSRVQDIKVTSSGVDIMTDNKQKDSIWSIVLDYIVTNWLEWPIKNWDCRSLPFRGEYYKIREERKYLVKNLIYPCSGSWFSMVFGVHFTRMIDGGLEAGPNVLAFRREGYTKNSISITELWGDTSVKGFHKMASRFWRQDWRVPGFWRRNYFTRSLQALVRGN